MKTKIGLTDDDVKGVTHILNENLCDEYVLYTKTRNCHWNVTGLAFSALHVFFEDQYKQLDQIIDAVAERVRSLGGWALGTLAEFAHKSQLKEMPGRYPDAVTMLSELAADHEAIVKRLRGDIATCEKKYHDAGTGNFLTDVMGRHEKMAWMLRAHRRGAKKEEAVKMSAASRRSGLDLTGDPAGSGE